MWLCSLACAVVCIAASAAGAQHQAQPQHLRVSLLAAEASAVPGQTMTLGLDFQLDPGWHVYWVNSGDSGEPPSVRWKLPQGFTAGQLEYPFPERLDHGSLTDYGYQNEVMLMTRVSAPTALQGQAVDLSAEVRWLVCREMCIPGRGEVKLSLPVASVTELRSRSKEADHFDRARARMPAAFPQDWKISASSQGDYVLLVIHAGKGISSATFFPLEAQQIENSTKPLVTAIADGVRLRLKKSDQLLKPMHRLRGVFVTGEHAYLVDAPIRSS